MRRRARLRALMALLLPSLMVSPEWPPAKSLAVEPEVVLMDEPCSALDPISTMKIEELVQEIKKEYTIVMVTHNMQQAARVSDYTAFFLNGKLIEHDTTDVISRSRTTRRRKTTSQGGSADMERQTRQEYIHDLEVVQDLVATMGDKALDNVEKSMKALLEGDTALAKSVMKADDVIDDMIVDVEDKCILLIAKQQPIAHDLRVIATGFKISTDIERIGDHAFDIAKTAVSVNEPLNPDCKHWIEELGNSAAAMLRRAVKAYRDKSVQEADEVRKLDKQMDDVFEHTFYALSDFVTKEGARQKGATQLLFIARFLERIGDHAVNIAEWVIYLETAEHIHQKKNRLI